MWRCGRFYDEPIQKKAQWPLLDGSNAAVSDTQVVLINVSFDNIYECPQMMPDQPSYPTWVNIGAANGNSHLGMVVAMDESLCGGKVPAGSCTIRCGGQCP